jgi:hypothetical protein
MLNFYRDVRVHQSEHWSRLPSDMLILSRFITKTSVFLNNPYLYMCLGLELVLHTRCHLTLLVQNTHLREV